MATVRQLLGKKGTTVHTIAPDATVFDALRSMADKDVGALVVLEEGEVLGLLTERDYARKVVLEGKVSRDIPVREIMNDQAVCVNSQHSVEACMALMTDKHTRHLPVLENGQLTGIVSIGDIVKAIIEDQKLTIQQLEHYVTGTPR